MLDFTDPWGSNWQSPYDVGQPNASAGLDAEVSPEPVLVLPLSPE